MGERGVGGGGGGGGIGACREMKRSHIYVGAAGRLLHPAVPELLLKQSGRTPDFWEITEHLYIFKIIKAHKLSEECEGSGN